VRTQERGFTRIGSLGKAGGRFDKNKPKGVGDPLRRGPLLESWSPLPPARDGGGSRPSGNFKCYGGAGGNSGGRGHHRVLPRGMWERKPPFWRGRLNGRRNSSKGGRVKETVTTKFFHGALTVKTLEGKKKQTQKQEVEHQIGF